MRWFGVVARARATQCGVAMTCGAVGTSGCEEAPSEAKAAVPNASSSAASKCAMRTIEIKQIQHLTDLGFVSKEVCNSKSFGYTKFIKSGECVLGDIVLESRFEQLSMTAYARAGPRETLHFEPCDSRAAIVTCGGLCPGLNTIVKNLTSVLRGHYGVHKVYGVRGGYNGFTQIGWDPAVELTEANTQRIHHDGGTALGSSRGGFDAEKILEWIRAKSVNQVYVVGGDGTHRGAFKLAELCHERGLNVAIAAIPKTIDNDIAIIDHSFGFWTAVSEATRAIAAAKTEAACNMPNGIGVVKLMGRSAGFLAAFATLAAQDVDLCLVPEVAIDLEASLAHLERVVESKGYAVVVVAEGAGADLLTASAGTDAGGNRKLPPIAEWLCERIDERFKANSKGATIKYIDPSYMVRSVPADAHDSYLCMLLAHAAAHGAMAGFTGFSVGLVNNHSVMIPIPELVSQSPRAMNAKGRTWERVLAITKQPCSPR